MILAASGFTTATLKADDNTDIDYPLDFHWLKEIKIKPALALGGGAVFSTGTLNTKYTNIENVNIENNFSSLNGFNWAAEISCELRITNHPLGLELTAGYEKKYITSEKAEINSVPTYLKHKADFTFLAALINIYPEEFPLGFGLGLVYYFPLKSEATIIGEFESNGVEYKRSIPVNLPDLADYTSLCLNTDWDLGLRKNVFGLELKFKPFLRVIADFDAMFGNPDGLKGYAFNLGLVLMPE